MTDPYGDTQWPVDDKGATQPPDGDLKEPVIPKAPPTGFEDSSGGTGAAVAGEAGDGGYTGTLGDAAVATAVAIGVAAAGTLAGAAAPVVGATAAAAAAAAYVIKLAEPPKTLAAEEDDASKDVHDEADEG